MNINLGNAWEPENTFVSINNQNELQKKLYSIYERRLVSWNWSKLAAWYCVLSVYIVASDSINWLSIVCPINRIVSFNLSRSIDLNYYESISLFWSKMCSKMTWSHLLETDWLICTYDINGLSQCWFVFRLWNVGAIHPSYRSLLTCAIAAKSLEILQHVICYVTIQILVN